MTKLEFKQGLQYAKVLIIVSNTKHNTYIANKVVLHQTDNNNPQELKHLKSETWSSALLDCGASKTVCGKEWLNQYISNFPQHQQQNIKYAPKQRCISFWRRKESDGY